MPKRKSSEAKEIEVGAGIYITFLLNKICLYVRIINSKIPKIYMIGSKKNQKNSGQSVTKKRREINIEEANQLMNGNINMCRL